MPQVSAEEKEDKKPESKEQSQAVIPTSSNSEIQKLDSQAQAKANQLPASGDTSNPFLTTAAMLIMAIAGSLTFLPKFKRK
ncbi:LPXTG cell wall anchor domain-containing protein [Streptococcus didelphis]|uniref:LPXTG cell wall anchor domain-containing protein n=2 Tax=Streptococcus didelphis TaxID=102886 RepID=A0ABY9LI67_9STRE|nr:LPXTG cell wall anchor domain-containing protein [Streptococcus didelphis]WMB28550.1 LPXTG cell wall anchor domain-containing protein [Streptococcus didelphis]